MNIQQNINSDNYYTKIGGKMSIYDDSIIVRDTPNKKNKLKIQEFLERSSKDIEQLTKLANIIQEKEGKNQQELYNYKVMFYANPTPMYIKDLDFKYTDFNKAFQIITTKEKEQLINKHNSEIFKNEELKQKLDDIELKIKRKGGVIRTTFKFNDKVYLVHETPFRDSLCVIKGYVGSIIDITEEFRESLAFEMMIDVNPYPMIMYSIKQRKFILLNMQAKKILRINDSDILGKSIKDCKIIKNIHKCGNNKVDIELYQNSNFDNYRRYTLMYRKLFLYGQKYLLLYEIKEGRFVCYANNKNKINNHNS